MLIRLFKYFHGYVKIKIEGYSPERFLNLCNVHQLLLWKMESKEASCEMYVSIEDYKKMRPLAQKTGTKIILLEKHGLPFFLHKFRKRKSFFAGMAICAVLIYGLSLFIWNIHIEGNLTQNTEELLEYLETLGVEHGIRKKEISCEVIETSLRSRYPNMLWVSAEMRGTRILIQIKENADPDIVSKIEEKDFAPVSLISETDGVIQSMIVRKGTPQVSIGDEVSVGQILVEGYYEVKNDAGEILHYEGTVADADIIIVGSDVYHDQFLTEYGKKYYTGRKRLGIEFEILDQNYSWLTENAFPCYETFCQTLEFHITENFYLPVSMKLLWFYEYKEEKQNYNRTETEKIANQRFLAKYENILKKGVQIIEKDVRIDINGNLCNVTGTVNLAVPVTKKVPAEIPELSNNTSSEGENEL